MSYDLTTAAPFGELSLTTRKLLLNALYGASSAQRIADSAPAHSTLAADGLILDGKPSAAAHEHIAAQSRLAFAGLVECE